MVTLVGIARYFDEGPPGSLAFFAGYESNLLKSPKNNYGLASGTMSYSNLN